MWHAFHFIVFLHIADCKANSKTCEVFCVKVAGCSNSNIQQTIGWLGEKQVMFRALKSRLSVWSYTSCVQLWDPAVKIWAWILYHLRFRQIPASNPEWGYSIPSCMQLITKHCACYTATLWPYGFERLWRQHSLLGFPYFPAAWCLNV